MSSAHWLIPFLLLTASPTPAGDEGSVTVMEYFRFDYESVQFVTERQPLEDDPRAFRAALDADGDGEVSQDEAAAGEIRLGDRPIPSECGDAFTLARLDGASPSRFSLYSFTDAAGPVENPAAIDRFWMFTAWYPPLEAGGEVVLRPGEVAQVDRLVECVSGASYGVATQGAVPDVLLLVGSEGVWIQPESLEPRFLRGHVDRTSFRLVEEKDARIFETNHVALRGEQLERVYASEVRFALGERPPEFPWAAAAAAGTSAAAVFFSMTEYGRFRWRRLVLALGLFTRLTRERALDHAKRDMLVEFVTQNPGATFGEIRSALGLGHGTLVHHLRVLEHQRLVRALRDGFRCRVFPVGMPVPGGWTDHPAQRQILDAVGEEPGLTQAQLAQRLRLPKRNVGYHALRLEERGLLRSDGGRRKRYFRSPA